MGEESGDRLGNKERADAADILASFDFEGTFVFVDVLGFEEGFLMPFCFCFEVEVDFAGRGGLKGRGGIVWF